MTKFLLRMKQKQLSHARRGNERKDIAMLTMIALELNTAFTINVSPALTADCTIEAKNRDVQRDQANADLVPRGKANILFFCKINKRI